MSVSVIVPAHNAESFLPNTILSVMGALRPNDELIVVCDNCSDNTLAACETMRPMIEAERINIKIIESGQGSVALARNIGIDAAKSEWIGFADHDDLVSPAIYTSLRSAAEQSGSDVARSGYIKVSKEKSEVNYPDFPLEHYAFFGIFVWNSIFRRRLLKQNGIKFIPGYGEDYEFNFEVAVHAKSQVFVNRPLYFWNIHQNNMHSRRTARDFCDRAAGIFSRHKTILQEWPNALACYKRWVAEYTNYLATFTQPDELEKAVDDSGLCQVRDIVSAF